MMQNTYTPPAGFLSPCELAGLAPDTPVAVALSGGADSVALLHILSQTYAGELYALHVHHGIRGEEADRDAAFCEAFAASLGIPFSCLYVNVPARAKQTGEGLETAARAARYEALSAHLSAHRIPLLATAHHADDQLETILQHLLRGTGLRGLCGIPAVRPLGDALVVRPLLQLPKEALLAYCTAQNLSFVTDSTNAEPCCPRNRLRNEVTPLLRELWPAAATNAARCAVTLAKDEAYLTELADDFLAAHGNSPSIVALAALPSPVFARVLRALLPKPPEAVHIAAAEGLVRTARPHARVNVPGAVLCVRCGKLCVLRDPPAAVPDYEVTLSPGETPLPNGMGVALLAEHADEAVISEHSTRFAHTARISLSAAFCEIPLFLRPRRAGDRILSGGCHKSVRKLPALSLFSPEERARMPLLCDSDGVLAVPFGPVRDGAAGRALTLFLFFN